MLLGRVSCPALRGVPVEQTDELLPVHGGYGGRVPAVVIVVVVVVTILIGVEHIDEAVTEPFSGKP